LWINAGALQNLPGIRAGLPVGCDGAGFILINGKWAALAHRMLAEFLLLQLLLLAGGIVLGVHPLAFYVLEKAMVPVVAIGALFLTAQDKAVELCHGKGTVNTVLLEPR